MSRVLLPLAQGCEELEAVTIIDLLRRGGIEVTSAGLESRLTPVTASRGTVLLPDTTLDEALEADYDMLVLPGGLPGADHLNADLRIIRRVQEMTAAGKFVCAICAAPRVLVRAGVLRGRRATSFPGAIPEPDLADIQYQEQAVVVDDTIITSRGPGTAMDFALTLIETLAGRERRMEVEKGLQRLAV